MLERRSLPLGWSGLATWLVGAGDDLLGLGGEPVPLGRIFRLHRERRELGGAQAERQASPSVERRGTRFLHFFSTSVAHRLLCACVDSPGSSKPGHQDIAVARVASLDLLPSLYWNCGGAPREPNGRRSRRCASFDLSTIGYVVSLSQRVILSNHVTCASRHVRAIGVSAFRLSHNSARPIRCASHVLAAPLEISRTLVGLSSG